MLSTCIQCGTKFACRPSEQRKYCGSECYRAHEVEHGRPSGIELTTFHCKVCDAPFTRRPGDLRQYRKTFGRDPLYCSTKCGGEGRRLSDERWQVHCVQCGKPMPIQRRPGGTVNRQRKICSPECRSAFRLAEHERLRPAEEREVQRNVTGQGYIRLRFPNKYGAKGREVLEHRYVMEQALGRELLAEETVHHKNGRRDDNTLGNLELRSGNHGPGGDVSAMVKWAHDFIARYPQFDRDGVFRPVEGAGEDHAAKVSAT